LVCQGQSIADSNSDFAQTIKLVVKDQIDEGNTKKEIYNFLISKYGEWIIFEPRLNKTNFLLWFLPYLTLVLGAFIILIMVRKGKKTKLY
jgi:cytochrome c-type biogenesis protein CcmH